MDISHFMNQLFTFMEYHYLEFLFLFYIVVLFLFFWFALCLNVIAKKTVINKPWMAWVPLANFYLMSKTAGKPVWWTAVFCIVAVLSMPTIAAPLFVIVLRGPDAQYLMLSLLPIFLAIPTLLTPYLIWNVISDPTGELAVIFIVFAVLMLIFFWVLYVLAWMAIARRRSKPSWLGILMILPIANQVVKGILAFSDKPAHTPKL